MHLAVGDPDPEPEPDPLVRSTDPDPTLPFSHNNACKIKFQHKILAKNKIFKTEVKSNEYE
jgi:hypothetical protein